MLIYYRAELSTVGLSNLGLHAKAYVLARKFLRDIC